MLSELWRAMLDADQAMLRARHSRAVDFRATEDYERAKMAAADAHYAFDHALADVNLAANLASAA